MLVLSRLPGQDIIIGDGVIQVTILGTMSDGSVKVGIAAPPGVPVHRREVFERIKANGEDLLSGRGEL